jgi:hypothetical protein
MAETYSKMNHRTDDLSDLAAVIGAINDPVARLLLTDRALTLRQAEELYLDSCLPEVVRLLEAALSDEELAQHPLMKMLRSHGSRGWEESVD